MCHFCSGLATAPYRFALIGGTGKIGSAVAEHLLERQPKAAIHLVGRRSSKGQQIVSALRDRYPQADIRLKILTFDQTCHHHATQPPLAWVEYFAGAAFDCVIHTAGPYMDAFPSVLSAAIAAEVPVYVDVADPLPYLENAVLLHHKAEKGGTTALVAAGAFPGMSNVLAVETASHVVKASKNERVGDVRFQYFTAGLGGSGSINLYITNLGFGDAMGLFQNGSLEFSTDIPGKILGEVEFFLDDEYGAGSDPGSNAARQRVGSKQVFAWPFPEAATVPTNLRSRGNSVAAMGTAPDIWNTMLGVLVFLVPRKLWREPWFSLFLANFSEPLVRLTDAWLRFSDPEGIGETHAMRIDVVSVDRKVIGSCVQAHDSFRQCVGQSCAEFALDCLENPTPGVFLPESRYSDEKRRRACIQRLTRTPGTFCYTGPRVRCTLEA